MPKNMANTQLRLIGRALNSSRTSHASVLKPLKATNPRVQGQASPTLQLSLCPLELARATGQKQSLFQQGLSRNTHQAYSILGEVLCPTELCSPIHLPALQQPFTVLGQLHWLGQALFAVRHHRSLRYGERCIGASDGSEGLRTTCFCAESCLLCKKRSTTDYSCHRNWQQAGTEVSAGDIPEGILRTRGGNIWPLEGNLCRIGQA